MDPFFLMMIALFAVMYFLMIRPQQKRAKTHQEMQSGLTAGDRVLLTSGLFGTIAYVGERQLIVELSPGMEVTLLKGNVARKVLPEDEEFEFTDEASVEDTRADEDALGLDATESDPTAPPEDTLTTEAASADESFFQDRTAEPRAEDTK